MIAGLFALLLARASSSAHITVDELSAVRELVDLLPALRQAAQRQSANTQDGTAEANSSDGTVAAMDRDDVLHWLMTCPHGLASFAVHAYEANVDGQALLTWSDERFAAAGIGAPDFAYPGTVGAARVAAQHSLDTARLRNGIAALRATLAPATPAPPVANKVTSSSMQLEMGELVGGEGQGGCSAAADGRVLWVVQYCRFADQSALADPVSRKVPSSRPWPQCCEAGSLMRIGQGKLLEPPREAHARERQKGARDQGTVWVHERERTAWLLNLRQNTSYAARALAMHCGGARLIGTPSVWRSRERNLAKLLDIKRGCWKCNERPHAPTLVSASRNAVLVRLAQHRYLERSFSHCRKVDWDFNLHLADDHGDDARWEDSVATGCNSDRPYCMFKNGIAPGRAYLLRHRERTDGWFGLPKAFGCGCEWSETSVLMQTEACVNDTNGDGVGCERKGACRADGRCSNEASLAVTTHEFDFSDVDPAITSTFAWVFWLLKWAANLTLLFLGAGATGLSPRARRFHSVSSTRYLHTVTQDSEKIPLEGSEGEDKQMQFEFGWCHAWKFRWSLIGRVLRVVDCVVAAIWRYPFFGPVYTAAFNESFAQAIAELFRGFGEEVWRVRRRLGAGGMGDVFLIERMAYNNGGERNEKEDAKNVTEQRVMKIFFEEQLRSLESTIMLNMQNALKKARPGQQLCKHILGYYPCKSERFNPHDAVSDGPDVPEGNYALLNVAEFGDLRHFCTNPLPEDVCKSIFRGLVEGLDAMRSVRWIHRDIKLENLLLNRRGETVICDFGLSQWVCSCPALANGEVSKCEKHCQRKCDIDTIADSTNSGTAPYLAPECLSQFHFSHKSDVWAAGAVLLEIATGTRVLQTDDTNADGLLGRCVEREGAPAAIKAHVDSALARNLPHMLSLEQVRKGVREDVLSDADFYDEAEVVDGDKRLAKKILEKILDEKEESYQLLSHSLKALLELMLEAEPAKRIDTVGIKKHPWWTETRQASEQGLAEAMERQDPVRLKRLFSELPEIRRAARRMTNARHLQTGDGSGRDLCRDKFVRATYNQMHKYRRLTEFLSIVAADQKVVGDETSGHTFYDEKLRPLYNALQKEICTFAEFKNVKATEEKLAKIGMKKTGRKKVAQRLRKIIARQTLRRVFLAARWICTFERDWTVCDADCGECREDCPHRRKRGTPSKEYRHAIGWPQAIEPDDDGKSILKAQRDRVEQLQKFADRPARTPPDTMVNFESERNVHNMLKLSSVQEYASAAAARLDLFEQLYGSGDEDQ